ncbi:hypothetical protein COB52_00750 [Candidatus Kaiserbacteria bacterium]|nr:MAG: hypothetical protein COB52_00750 [Candidatus Kaiserbacteria bacterium]
MNKLLLILLLLPIFASANSAGLVSGIWFETTPVTDFKEVSVYSVVHNQTDEQIQGIATLFVDGDAVVAEDVVVKRGDITRVGIPYKFSAGPHKVNMHFTANNESEVTSLELTGTIIIVVKDSDGDGIKDSDEVLDIDDSDPLVNQEEGLTNMSKQLLQKITKNKLATSTILTSINDARERGATVMRDYEEESRESLEELQNKENLTKAEEGKKREHQLAAVGASGVGAVLESDWLFYVHVLVLVLSVGHLGWKFFASRFRTVEEE